MKKFIRQEATEKADEIMIKVFIESEERGGESVGDGGRGGEGEVG